MPLLHGTLQLFIANKVPYRSISYFKIIYQSGEEEPYI